MYLVTLQHWNRNNNNNSNNRWTESIPTGNITNLRGSYSTKDRKALQRVIETAPSIADIHVHYTLYTIHYTLYTISTASVTSVKWDFCTELKGYEKTPSTAATVCSPCSRLAKDTQVSAAVPPDHRAASYLDSLPMLHFPKQIRHKGLEHSLVFLFVCFWVFFEHSKEMTINIPGNLVKKNTKHTLV